jgi:hypothetical protein
MCPTAIGIIFGECPLQKFFTRKLIVTKSEKFILSCPYFSISRN